MNRKITLADIAFAAGVSAMTVSRAINGRPGVSEDERKRIAELVNAMNYVPRRTARELSSGRLSQTVGVVIPHIANTIFPEMLQNIENVLSSNGYRLLLCCSYNNPVKEFHEISALLERRVDGIIWSPIFMEESRNAAELIFREKCPLVFLDRRIPDVEADAVVVDDYEGALAMTGHLIRNGAATVGYLGARTFSYVAMERLRGYRDALKQHGIKENPLWIIDAGSDVAAGRSAAAELWSRKGPRPEALFCFNDPLALGTEQELLNLGVKIPDELLLGGFSNTLESEIARVPISSVFQDAANLGRTAASMLLSRMISVNYRVSPSTRVIKTHLVVRESSSPSMTKTVQQ